MEQLSAGITKVGINPPLDFKTAAKRLTELPSCAVLIQARVEIRIASLKEFCPT
jgi:hypothetical protein